MQFDKAKNLVNAIELIGTRGLPLEFTGQFSLEAAFVSDFTRFSVALANVSRVLHQRLEQWSVGDVAEHLSVPLKELRKTVGDLRHKHEYRWTSLMTPEEHAKFLEQAAALVASDEAPPPPAELPPGQSAAPAPKQSKRSTEPGEAKTKIVAALIQHHQFDSGGEGSCTNEAPIGVGQLADLADVAKSTVSEFFNEQFGDEDSDGRLKSGHRNYKITCRKKEKLVKALRLLQGDFKPRELLYGRHPWGEGRSDDDD